MSSASPPNIRVPERGHTDINTAQWSELRKSTAFWQLVDSRRLAVEQRSSATARLNGRAWVGRADIDGTILEVHEKIPGATASLMAAATPILKQHDVASPATEIGPLIGLVVAAFLRSLRQYVTRGRDWTFDVRIETSPLIGGRLDTRATIALRARGARHLTAFHRTIIDRATRTNEVLLAALREVDMIAALHPIQQRDIQEAHGMSVLFEDCVTVDVLTRSPSLAADAAELAEDTEPSRADLLNLAALLLQHRSLEPDAVTSRTAPTTWFVNLEMLFERVVLTQLRAHFEGTACVERGAAHHRTVLHDRDLLQADPDLVVTTDERTLSVGDVKYKTWTGSVDPGDLYQLLTHASAFDCNETFLVYPDERYQEIYLGHDSRLCNVRVFLLDVTETNDGLSRLVGAIRR